MRAELGPETARDLILMAGLCVHCYAHVHQLASYAHCANRPVRAAYADVRRQGPRSGVPINTLARARRNSGTGAFFGVHMPTDPGNAFAGNPPPPLCNMTWVPGGYPSRGWQHSDIDSPMSPLAPRRPGSQPLAGVGRVLRRVLRHQLSAPAATVAARQPSAPTTTNCSQNRLTRPLVQCCKLVHRRWATCV